MVTSNSGPESSYDSTAGAIRLTFDYEGEQLKVVSEEKVEKMVPLFKEVEDKSSGAWIELKDKEGNILHTQAMDIPFAPDLESFSNDPKKPSIIRKKTADLEGGFSILIPDIPEVSEVEVFSSPVFSEPGLSGKAKSILHHNLRKEG